MFVPLWYNFLQELTGLPLFRDEDPLGTWTIRVSDQNKEDESGKFLGWTMTLWGSVVDASKVKQWEVPLIDNTLPPLPSPETP